MGLAKGFFRPGSGMVESGTRLRECALLLGFIPEESRHEGAFDAPDWSPDRRTMVFHREVNHTHNLTTDPGVQERRRGPDPRFKLLRTNTAVVGCSFSPRGDHLVCQFSTLNSPSNGLAVANADGSNGKVILEDRQKEMRGTAWSPSGD